MIRDPQTVTVAVIVCVLVLAFLLAWIGEHR